MAAYVLLCLFALLCCNSFSKSEDTVESLVDEYWKWKIENFPEFATSLGIHDNDDKLTSYTEVFWQSESFYEDMLKRALEVKKTRKNSEHALNYMIQDLETFIAGLAHDGEVFILSGLEGVQIDFEYVIEQMKFETASDYKKLLKRMEAIPRQLDDVTELMKAGIRMRKTHHAVSMRKVKEQFAVIQVANPESSVFYKPFRNFPDSFTDIEKSELIKDAKSIISNVVLKAFKKLGDFVEKEYFPELRSNISISSITNGKSFYKQALKFHLSMDIEPEEVHNIGLKEVTRIEEEMKKVISNLGYNDSVKEFSQRIRSNESFFSANGEDLLNRYKDIVSEQILPKIPKLFKGIPKTGIIIEAAPGNSQIAVPYYRGGNLNGTRKGTFVVNTGNFKSGGIHELMSIALHEAYPGHHMQFSHLRENEKFPIMVRAGNPDSLGTVPTSFPSYTAFIEGWGLYSEYLGEELELYEDTYTLFGRLAMEMFRAARLVVDTGIHAFNWTDDKAVEYMATYISMPLDDIRKEVDRYVTWPGQACGYKIGELKIKELREKAKKDLGEKFNVQDYHEVVLSCMGSLKLLEECVETYIKNTLRT